MKKVFIIAEAGVNHNGSIKSAKRMIDIASEAGCDAVKFQTFKTGELLSRFSSKSKYQKLNTNKNESQYDMLKKFEIDKNFHKKLIKHANKRNIIFLSSAFDLKSIDMLDELGLNIFKIPSGEITNLPYLRKVGKLKKELILSTGMSDIYDIKNALRILTESGTSRKKIRVLHCNTEYPTPFGDVNLKAMVTMKKKLNLDVGYSDHTLGIEVPIAAVSLGAVIIEKHFTLSRKMKGPDHKSSLEPNELKAMVRAIRNIEASLGNGLKEVSKSEKKNINIVRKSIFARRNIKKGEKFSEENITTKRPGNGISPMQWDKVIGKIAKKDFKIDELIEI